MFIYKLFGVFWVVIGLFGLILPLLPTTPFLLLASYCFAKSSPRLHKMLLDNSLLGPPIKDWQQYKAVTLKTKITAFTMIAVSLVFSLYVLSTIWLKLTLIGLLVIPVIYLYKLPILNKK